MARPGRAGNAVAYAVAERSVRGELQGGPEATPRDSCGTQARKRDERLVQGGAGTRYGAPEWAFACREGGGVRGGQLRGEGLFPAAIGLHHVYTRQRGVLRGLPPRPAADA